MAEVMGATLVGEALREQGADAVFTIVAGPVIAAIGACGDLGVRPIGVHHEQAAVMMAAAQGFVAGKVGVAMTGSGPGVTNAMTGVHVAWDNCFPVVVLGGSSSLGQRGLNTFQEADSVTMMRSITKWSAHVDRPERMRELISMAFHKAISGRPGPVYLDLPNDVLHAMVDEEAVRPARHRGKASRPQGDPEQVARAAQLLERAEHPLLLIGKGLRWAGDDVAEDLRRLVERLGMPFVPAPMARGYVPDDHPLCAASARRMAISSADVVLIVGARVNWIFEMGETFAPDAQIVHVDVSAEEIGSNRDVAVGIVGDAGHVLRQLNDALPSAAAEGPRLATKAWRDALQAQSEKNAGVLEARMRSDDMPISHYRLMHDIREVAPRDTFFTVDGEVSAGAARQVIGTYTPVSQMNMGTNGCIGTGVPFAIGAKVARPELPVVSISGDSAFGFNGMEVETALRCNLPIVFVVDNNQGILGNTIERRMFRREHPERVGMYVPNARYERIIEAFGGHPEYVERPQKIRPALERAFAAGRAALVHVVTDPEEVGLIPRRGRSEMQY